MNRDVTDPWGAHASIYDRIYAPLTGQVGRSLIAMVDQRMRPGSTVLDIACGSGALLVPALERAARLRAEGNADFVVGCDYSEGMVESARRKAGAIFDPELFRCDVENGQALSYSDASFDAVFSCFGILLFEDRRAGWREAARVLSPGGLFATSTWMAPEQNEWFRVQYGPVAEALPDRVKAQLPQFDSMKVASAEGLRTEIEEAGFTNIEVDPFHTTFVLPSLDTAWTAMLDNPAAAPLFSDCDADEMNTLREAFDAGLKDFTKGGKNPIFLQASSNLLTARVPT